MPTLKRHLGEMDSRWLNPKGALDKQREEERGVSGRNFPFPGIPMQPARRARIPPQPRSGGLSVLRARTEPASADLGSSLAPDPRAGCPQRPRCLFLPGFLLGHFSAGHRCQHQEGRPGFTPVPGASLEPSGSPCLPGPAAVVLGSVPLPEPGKQGMITPGSSHPAPPRSLDAAGWLLTWSVLLSCWVTEGRPF